MARVAGIDVHVHATFLLLLLWIGLTHFAVRHRWGDAAAAVAFILVLFGIVVLHELGHALTARHFGIRTRDITLLPIGGVARLERIPEEPRQELLVALAGPAVNVALALACFLLLGAQTQISRPGDLDLIAGSFLANLMWVNVGLTIFNLLPAFPMDGGRVLRALLATRMEYVRATAFAARIGQGLAMILAFIGLGSMFFGTGYSNPFLVLIALFVWVGASQEAGLVRMRSMLRRVTAGQLMTRNFQTVNASEPLGAVAERLKSGGQSDFPVLDASGRVAGLLTHGGLLEGLSRRGRDATAEEFMSHQFDLIDPDRPVDSISWLSRAGSTGPWLVARNGQLLGLIPFERVEEYLALRSAMQGQSGSDAIPQPPVISPPSRG